MAFTYRNLKSCVPLKECESVIRTTASQASATQLAFPSATSVISKPRVNLIEKTGRGESVVGSREPLANGIQNKLTGKAKHNQRSGKERQIFTKNLSLTSAMWG